MQAPTSYSGWIRFSVVVLDKHIVRLSIMVIISIVFVPFCRLCSTWFSA